MLQVSSSLFVFRLIPNSSDPLIGSWSVQIGSLSGTTAQLTRNDTSFTTVSSIAFPSENTATLTSVSCTAKTSKACGTVAGNKSTLAAALKNTLIPGWTDYSGLWRGSDGRYHIIHQSGFSLVNIRLDPSSTDPLAGSWSVSLGALNSTSALVTRNDSNYSSTTTINFQSATTATATTVTCTPTPTNSTPCSYKPGDIVTWTKYL